MKKKNAREYYWIKDKEKNKKRLETLYPKSTRENLEKAFPEKNWQSIKRAANNFGFSKVTTDGWNGALDKLIKKSFGASQNLELADRAAAKMRLINAVNKFCGKNNLKPKKWNTILKHAHELGLSWGLQESAENAEEEKQNPWDEKALLEYLSAKRSAKDLEKYFGEAFAEIEKKLPASLDNRELISYRNTGGQYVYFYREKAKNSEKTQSKIWQSKYGIEEGAENEINCGSLFIEFPDEDWREIRIFPLAEAHIGSELHEEKRFNDYLALEKNPYHHFMINGSIFPMPPKGRIEDKIDYILALEDRIRTKLQPIAHKILWAHQGCTENWIDRAFNFDPLANICADLNIPYFKRPVISVIVWRGKIFRFYSIHGTTTAKKRGSMINAVTNLLDQFEMINFIIMSHQMSGMENVVPRRIRDRVSFYIKDRNQHLVITPSFRRYEGSIEERKGQAPPARGSHAMILFPDGNCKTSD